MRTYLQLTKLLTVCQCMHLMMSNVCSERSICAQKHTHTHGTNAIRVWKFRREALTVLPLTNTHTHLITQNTHIYIYIYSFPLILCVHVCVCMYIYIYVCMYVCVCLCDVYLYMRGSTVISISTWTFTTLFIVIIKVMHRRFKLNFRVIFYDVLWFLLAPIVRNALKHVRNIPSCLCVCCV